jgi:RNA polymerase sigma-70 factor (ECF subfamily)
LTQETFLRAYRGQESLRDPDAARDWLYRIATHVCLDRLRRRGPQFSMESVEASDRVESVVSPSPSALEIAESKETSACVQRCLDYLSDSYRAVILLHGGHSLTAPEIAELLGVELGAVKIRIHRARRKLQQLMEHGCAVSNKPSGLPVCAPKCGPPSSDPRETHRQTDCEWLYGCRRDARRFETGRPSPTDPARFDAGWLR